MRFKKKGKIKWEHCANNIQVFCNPVRRSQIVGYQNGSQQALCVEGGEG